MPTPIMTTALAWAAATDAGNRSMREAGRTAWSAEDYAAAAEELHRLIGQERQAPKGEK